MIKSVQAIDYQDVDRPVAVLSTDYVNGRHQQPHSHRRGQLIFASRGVIVVLAAQRSYTIPPQRALWVPGGVEHESYHNGNVALRTLYISEGACEGLPTTCQVIEVGPLFRELIVEAAKLPIEYNLDGRDSHIMGLILDEIISSRRVPLHVPMPHSTRLLSVCTNILLEPAQDDALADAANAANMGRRTFTRAFRRETGESFASWRRHVRLMKAVALLSEGQGITSVAYDVGYTSASAFTAMFRKAFGVAPTHYFRASEADPNG